METAPDNLRQLGTSSRELARRLLRIGENRLELLTLEMQEEGKRLLQAILLALAAVTFGLLAGIALTAAIVVLFWASSPVAVLLILAGLYAVAGVCFYRQLTRLLGNWQTLSATLDQLRKDCAGLEKSLA